MAANQLTLALLAFALPLAAQSDTFYGGCVLGSMTTHPQPAGCFIEAHELSKSAKIWQFAETDYSIAHHKIISAVRPAGIYTPMRTFGALTMGILGDAGVASDGAASTGSYAGGALATYPIPKTKWMLFAGFRYAYSGVAGVQRIVGFGIGRTN